LALWAGLVSEQIHHGNTHQTPVCGTDGVAFNVLRDGQRLSGKAAAAAQYTRTAAVSTAVSTAVSAAVSTAATEWTIPARHLAAASSCRSWSECALL